MHDFFVFFASPWIPHTAARFTAGMPVEHVQERWVATTLPGFIVELVFVDCFY